MSFILGFLLGLIAAIILACVGLWLITWHASKEATAKFLQGMALVLTHKPKPPEAPPAATNGPKPKPKPTEAPAEPVKENKPPQADLLSSGSNGLKSTSPESLLVRSNGQKPKEASRERKTDA